jgi:excinuclease ABC subunit C
MTTLPYRIEAFDISNIQGTNSVASMVVWEAGRPKKKDYRKYKIKGVVGPDDFKSMSEVIERRIKHLLANNLPLPDLFLIDGGKGQLSAAREVLLRHGFPDQPIMGIAKREEELFLPGREESIKLDKRSHVLKLIQQVRNEAHRFAITFHRQVRTKQGLQMVLDEIPGIGLKRKEQILQRFGSLENLRQASIQQIQELLGSKTGDKLFSILHPEA